MTGHAGYIAAAYLAAAIVIGGAVLWVLAERRRLIRRLAELEAAGLKRRGSG